MSSFSNGTRMHATFYNTQLPQRQTALQIAISDRLTFRNAQTARVDGNYHVVEQFFAFLAFVRRLVQFRDVEFRSFLFG
jgi:Tfp pilus assembly protein PilO